MPFMTLAQIGDSFWMPQQASESSGLVDWLFYLILIISTVFFVGIVIAMVVFIFKYRRREGYTPKESPSHSLGLELTWSVIPLIIVLALFVFGFRGFMDQFVPPEDAMQVNVIGRKWYWSFEYPDTGLQVSNEFHVPVNKPVKLVITSDDVIHSVFIPAFRLKKDAVPGRYNKAWFQATKTGEYDLFCTEYCGTNHSSMLAKVIVQTESEFNNWMKSQISDPLEDLTDEQFAQYLADPDAFIAANPDLGITQPLWKKGEELYKSLGCVGCHSTNGTKIVGPSFKGIWMAQRPLADGTTVLANEDYIHDSIINPLSHIAAGCDPVMPTYKGRIKEREIAAIIEYFKTLSK